MKSGVNAWIFGNLSLDKKIEKARELGFDGLELNYGDDVQEDTHIESTNDLALPSLCTSLFWKYPLNSPEEEVRRKGITVGISMAKTAAKLGAKVMLVVPGVNNPSLRYEELLALSASSLKEIGKAARDVGVKVGIENVWNKLLYSPAEYVQFIRDLGEGFGAYFDVGNVMEIGHPVQWLRELKGMIIGVHFKDYDVQSRRFVPLLQGDVPWKEVVNLLYGYDGYAMVEQGPYKGDRYQAVIDAKAAMSTILSYVSLGR
ncbi:MAG: sugar phosphate isomerase/epimerase family protein [Thermoprotei archaeon]